jgi:hypothetical protein
VAGESHGESHGKAMKNGEKWLKNGWKMRMFSEELEL